MVTVLLINPPLLRPRSPADRFLESDIGGDSPEAAVPRSVRRRAGAMHLTLADLLTKQKNIECPPLGLMYLAAALEMDGHRVQIWDGQIDPMSAAAFIELLDDLQPDIVGITVLTEFYRSALQVAETVKAWRPDVLVVFGGPHASFRAEEALQTGQADIVVHHEGEQTIRDLARCVENGDRNALPTVAGISFLTGSQGGRRVQRTEARPFARELDVLPLPSRQLVDLSRYRRAGVMISSRGCPFRCIYCSASAYAGHRYRFRSPESVVAEMVHLNRDLGIPHVDIVDDTMTAVSHRTREICRQLARSRFAGTWRAFSRLDSLDHDLLAQMASCGCNSIFFGVESGDQGVLDAINKKVGIEDIVRVVDWTRQAGIEPECSFMVGHHADTSESIEATVALARRLRYECGVRLHPFFINTPFPGTALFEEAESFGVTILSQEWSDYTFDHCIINTKHLTSYEIQHWYFRALLELAPDGVVSPSPGDFDSRILLNTLMLSSLVSRKAYTPWLPEMADVNTREGGMS